jgi:hypothetical protein
MCRAIDAAHNVDEVKDIRDQAARLEHYARQAQNTDAERRAAEIRLRAERKAGQIISKMPKAKPGPNGVRSTSTTDPPTLEELGITKDQSSQWQKLGEMKQRDFDLAIGESVKPPTTKGILRIAKEAAEPVRDPVSDDALWLWGRLRDFERHGLLDQEPGEVMATMTDEMKDDVHTLAPRVAAWLKRIGAVQ